jgi:hypothetical protein
MVTITENQLIMSEEVLKYATDEEISQLRAICQAIRERSEKKDA